MPRKKKERKKRDAPKAGTKSALIVRLFDEGLKEQRGLSFNTIAKLARVDHSTVSRVVGRYRPEGAARTRLMRCREGNWNGPMAEVYFKMYRYILNRGYKATEIARQAGLRDGVVQGWLRGAQLSKAQLQAILNVMGLQLTTQKLGAKRPGRISTRGINFGTPNTKGKEEKPWLAERTR